MKDKLIPVISVLVGVLAFSLTYRFLQVRIAELEDKERALYEGAARIRVAAATRDIPAETTIARGDIGTITVFRRSVGENVVTPEQVEMLYGRKALFSISARDPIFWSYIEGAAPDDASLAQIVTPGMRAISISVSGAASVSGMVEPNDRVDVLGTFTFPSSSVPGEMELVTLTVLQDVTVIATGRDMARKPQHSARQRGSAGYSTVTLEVTPREAELLVFAEQIRGRLVLSLRNPRDMSFEPDLPDVNFQKLEASLPELNLYRQRSIRRKTIQTER